MLVHPGVFFARHVCLVDPSSWWWLWCAAAGSHHTTTMAKGDVHVLKRIDKADRRADKATKRLMLALAKTSRNNRKKVVPVAVTLPTWPALSFTDDTHIIPHADLNAVSRRLKRKKDGKRRIFSTGEVLEGFETVTRLIVVPKQPCATVQTLAAVAAKDDGATFKISPNRVLLFYTRNEDNRIITGQSRSTHVFLRKVVLRGEHVVFYASAEDPSGDCAPPRVMNLDSESYGRIQRSVAGMVGAQMSL